MNRLLWRAGIGSPEGRWDSDPAAEASRRARIRRTGLHLLLLVVTSLFLLFLIAFIARAQLGDWQPLATAGAPLAHPWLLWLNTIWLLLSSICLHWAKTSARRPGRRHTLTAFWLAGLFALAFLCGQLWAWQLLTRAGYGVAANPASSFFFLLTGLHGLHLLGGLAAWAVIGLKLQSAARKASAFHRIAPDIALCTTYWHYLLGLWLVLFAVLGCAPETYQAIAALCGLR